MPSTTPRALIPYPLSSDNNNASADMQALATQADTIFAIDKQGLLSARPAAGTRGGWYFATDAGSERLYRDSGTAYWEVPLLSKSVTFGGSVGATNVSNVAFADNANHTWETESGTNRWRFRNNNLSVTSGFLFTGGTGNTDIAKIDYTGGLFAVGTDHYVGPYAFGTGTGVSRLHLLLDASAGTVAAEGDGANRDLSLRVKGTGLIRFQSATPATVGTIDNTGSISAAGSGHNFGTGALGGTGAYISLGDFGNTAITLVKALGTPTNVELDLRAKGTGAIALQNANGNGIATFASNGQVTFGDGAGGTLAQLSTAGGLSAIATDHQIGPFAFGTGTSVSRLHMFFDNAGVFLKSEGDGADRQMVYDTKGGGAHIWRSAAGGTQLATLTSAGLLSVVGTDSLFGSYAFGAAGGRVRLVGTTGYGKIASETNTGNADLYVAAQGSGQISFQTNGANAATLNAVNAFAAVGPDHYFGPYAFNSGTSVSRLHMNFNATQALLFAEGDGANRDLVFVQKGTGLIKFGTTVATQAWIDSTGGIAAQGNDHYLGGYGLGFGTSVSRLHLSTVSTGITMLSEGDGSNRDFAWMQKGTGSFYWQTPGPSNLMQLDSGGNLHAKGQTNTFGQGVFAAAQAYTTIGDDGAGNALITAGHGTSANAHLSIQTKGTGTLFLRNGSGTIFGQFDSNLNASLGAQSALATGATNGFIYFPVMNGAPTGVPTAIGSQCPFVFDTASFKLWARVGGVWKGVVLT